MAQLVSSKDCRSASPSLRRSPVSRVKERSRRQRSPNNAPTNNNRRVITMSIYSLILCVYFRQLVFFLLIPSCGLCCLFELFCISDDRKMSVMWTLTRGVRFDSHCSNGSAISPSMHGSRSNVPHSRRSNAVSWRLYAVVTFAAALLLASGGNIGPRGQLHSVWQ